jgi:DNA-binding transcriptional LysR family regulator
MELNHLRYFYEVARQGSFTKASRELRVAQPAVSRIVKTLEEREGVKLLDRGKKGVALTPEGRLFFRECEAIFSRLSRLREETRARREECAGDLGLGASDNLCNYVLPGLFIEFWKKHPRVRFELFNGGSEAIKRELTARRAELGVFHTPVREAEFETERLAAVEFAIVCSPKNDLLLGSGRRFNPRLLERAYYIGCRKSDYLKPYPTLTMLRSLGVKPRVFFETNSQETQKRMALEEYGYTVLPRFMVRAELASGRLVEIRAPRPISSTLILARPRGRTLSRPALVFQEFLRERVAAGL